MKFIIKKGSELFKKLKEMESRAHQCNKAAKALVKSFGSRRFHPGRHCVGGGITAIEFDEKPSGWVRYSPKYAKLFMPAAKDKDAWIKINALPVVKTEEVAKALGFEQQTYFVNEQMHWISCPGLQWKKDFILVSANEHVDFKALPGMKEILESEFIKLSKLK